MTPPTTIHIVSDDNTLTYQEAINPTKKEPIYIYKYTKSENKKGRPNTLASKGKRPAVLKNPM